MSVIKTLLLTGENNHDWQRTAPFVRDLLEASGKFSVTLTEQPSEALEDDLSSYRLFFLDYNGASWSDVAQANFLQAVQNGAGVAVLHASNNSFEGWAEYEKMIGLLWRPTGEANTGSGHGSFHQFEVHITAPEHPITRNQGDFVTEDELYHRLAHATGADMEILADAFSDPKEDGSGRREPILAVTRYGEGRVFHTVLGHIWPGDPNGEYRGSGLFALQSQGFQNTLLRGCEWAATGDVAETA